MDFDTVGNYLIWTHEENVNTAALDLGNKVIVIDAMRKREHAAEWRTITENYFNQPVTAVFLTHHHSDPTMGIFVYRDVPIISSYNTRELMAQSRKNYVTETFTRGYSISGDTYSLHFVQTDGHTKGSSYGW